MAGCAARDPRLGGAADLAVVGSSELPRPGARDAIGDAGPYYVGPNDRLIVDVFGLPDLSAREVQVDAAGRISFPLVGAIEVAGLTPQSIEDAIAVRLRASYVRDPKVSVNLKEALSRTITVEGQVRRPGIYPVVGQMSLLRSIARAEGTDENSKLDEVVVFRTVEGKRYAALYNLDAIRHGAYPDPQLYANDVVMVGTEESRRLFRDAASIGATLASPLILLIQTL
jgi:polysaccharide export outer membrane protein